MPTFLDRLTPVQRQVVVGLASVVVLLAVAIGAVAFGAGGDDPTDEAVRTEGEPGDAVEAGSSTSSSPSSSSSSSSTAVSTTTTAAAGTGAGGRAAPSTTARRSGSGTTAPTTPTGGGGGPTSTTAAPTATGCTTGGSGGVAAEIASRYCDHRGSGAARMTRSAQLDQAAQSWAEHMAATGDFRHNPDLRSIVQAACGCAHGENIAWQQPPDLGAAWSFWLGSTDHRRNLDNPAGGIYGTGAARSADGREYYVHMFGWT